MLQLESISTYINTDFLGWSRYPSLVRLQLIQLDHNPFNKNLNRTFRTVTDFKVATGHSLFALVSSHKGPPVS